MTEIDPWANQPDVTPYPTTDERSWSWLENALDKAERRGAERGWQESVEWFAGLGGNVRVPDRVLQEAEDDNPYRRPAVAPSEPVQQSGDHQDTPDTEKTGEAL